MTDKAALRRELAELTRQVHTYVEWAAESGADALACSDEPAPPRNAARAHATVPIAIDRPSAKPLASAEPRAAAPRLDGDARVQRLAVMAEEVERCTRCRLHGERTQTVFSRGNAQAELMFVGEGPGADEDRLGEPFVGKAGQLLDKMIEAMGYRKGDVYVCNVIKCRPPNNRKPEPDEIEACVGYLREQIELVGPKVIVALGATGVQGLLGTSVGITRMRGNWKLYQGRIPIMPTFHPAYLLRQPEKKREVWEDLQQVMKRLGREAPRKKVTPDTE